MRVADINMFSEKRLLDAIKYAIVKFYWVTFNPAKPSNNG